MPPKCDLATGLSTFQTSLELGHHNVAHHAHIFDGRLDGATRSGQRPSQPRLFFAEPNLEVVVLVVTTTNCPAIPYFLGANAEDEHP